MSSAEEWLLSLRGLPFEDCPIGRPTSWSPSPTRSVAAELKDDGAGASPLLASEMRRVHDRLGR